jgi:hypothetical protein
MPEEKKQKLRALLAGFEASAPPPPSEAPAGAFRRTEPIDIGAPGEPGDAGPAEYDETESELPDFVAESAPDEERSVAAEPAAAGERAAEAELADEPALADDELRALIATPRFQHLKPTEALPAGLDERGVVLKLGDGRGGRVAFEKIQGVAVASVAGLAARPVVIVDLLLNWRSLEESELRAVRFRSDRFDPRPLAPGAAGPLEALRAFVEQVLARSGAAPLPDAEAARAAPLRRFADLESYQREVLEVG